MFDNNQPSGTPLNKYFQQSRSVELQRSALHFADYNPRTISDEGRRQLKRSIKRYGVVGGIVVNAQTGNTVVGGHQKLRILDELNHYDGKTHEGDYLLRVELIDVDAQTEKQLNIALNNPNVGGEWDLDALARLVPDIDYKAAGLTEADLNMIGCDYLLKTQEENAIAADLDDLMEPVRAEHEAEMAARKAEREVAKANNAQSADLAGPEPTWEDRVQAMKDLKASVKDKAANEVKEMEVYVMLSFDTFKAKAAFMQRFGYDPYMKILKGEAFADQVERVE